MAEIIKKTVLITDEKHPYYNQRLEGFCAYYDLYHTGNGPDLYIATTPEGSEIRLLTDQINIQDYQNQEMAETEKSLGVKINDIVMISRSGSGSQCANFDLDQPHLITKMSYNGQVTFDNGKAEFFRPDMLKYNGDLPVQNDFTKSSKNTTGLPF
jgi:hypothetical protein